MHPSIASTQPWSTLARGSWLSTARASGHATRPLRGEPTKAERTLGVPHATPSYKEPLVRVHPSTGSMQLPSSVAAIGL
jgi:hypothetical protein